MNYFVKKENKDLICKKKNIIFYIYKKRLKIDFKIIGGSNATGNLSVDGTFQEGSTLTADISNISDENGQLSFTYQWQILDENSNFVNIDGEVSNTFTIPLNESYLNKFIRLTVVSTDINGNTTEFESLSYKITNYLPVFDSNPVTNATEDTEYRYEINVSDEDLSGNLDLSENITIRSTTLPSWLTLKDNEN